MTFQRLANAQLVIRPFEPADADEFVRAAHESIETVGKWMSWCSLSFARESALEWFASCDQDRAAGRAFDMGIFCATTGQLLGGAGINQLSPHHRYSNIGYWVRQSRQGYGIARQAVSPLNAEPETASSSIARHLKCIHTLISRFVSFPSFASTFYAKWKHLHALYI
ncbi:hypothetical protein WP8S18E04_36600 [Aeromonas caviae]|uniref:GNAT family N-acetyltransferase n=1 Tax=Aeromonas caviae TaxID=648 RepID=UPI0015DD3A28|nr:hypothetical protein WP8S18E04_36600 [Aeromonas caviae]